MSRRTKPASPAMAPATPRVLRAVCYTRKSAPVSAIR